MSEEIKANMIYVALIGKIVKIEDDMWDFIKAYHWVNEDDSNDLMVSISLNTFREISVDEIEEEHRDMYNKLKFTMDIYFSDPEITEVQFHRNW